jgi:glycosyltransferase involved in cell wall biosynthesis
MERSILNWWLRLPSTTMPCDYQLHNFHCEYSMIEIASLANGRDKIRQSPSPLRTRSKSPLKILFLASTKVADRASGSAVRDGHMRTALEQLGEVHTLVISCTSEHRIDDEWDAHNVKCASYNQTGMSFRALRQRRRIRTWITNALHSQHYDVIVARYISVALLVPFRFWSRLVIDLDDVIKTPPAEAGNFLSVRAKRCVRNLIACNIVRFARHVWVVNPLDAAAIRSKSMSWLGNVVKIPERDRPTQDVVHGRILIVGDFEYPPNAEGLRWFATEVLPPLSQRFSSLELHAVGKFPGRLRDELAGTVTFRGFVDDLAPEYDRAAFVIVPITSGGGTQVKLIDALAHGRPLVASAFSHRGYSRELHDGEHLRVAEDVPSWIEQCTWVLQHPDLASAMGARGYLAVKAAYGVDQMNLRVQKTLLDIAQHR